MISLLKEVAAELFPCTRFSLLLNGRRQIIFKVLKDLVNRSSSILGQKTVSRKLKKMKDLETNQTVHQFYRELHEQTNLN